MICSFSESVGGSCICSRSDFEPPYAGDENMLVGLSTDVERVLGIKSCLYTCMTHENTRLWRCRSREYLTSAASKVGPGPVIELSTVAKRGLLLRNPISAKIGSVDFRSRITVAYLTN